MTRSFVAAGLGALLAASSNADAQYAPGKNSSPNVKVVAHVPLDGPRNRTQIQIADIEIEQELTRPYAYVSRGRRPDGFNVIDLREPARARVLYSWFVENPELHQGRGVNGKYFKLKGRYYYTQAFQFRGTGPDRDLSAVVVDVTSLPDTARVKEVGRIRVPDAVGGAHNLFAYKHSDGRVLLFLTVEAPAGYPHGALVYDMEKFVAGAPDRGLVGGIPLPEPRGAARGYHDVYVAYDVANHRDLFYGGGPETTPLGGNYVYDITDLKAPKLVASVITQESMQSGGHTFVATPDGRYALTLMTSLGHQPVRFFDLKPALDGKAPVIRRPIAEWTPDYKKSGHMIEIRWPYVFLAMYEDGLHILDMRNAADPVQVGFYDTFVYRTPYGVGTEAQGGYGVDVRNADGLIVMADMHSGFWAFRLDGFDGWNGHDWGMPNISSVQDWDHGPEGAPKTGRIS
ncbi:MAG: hypothetical protein HY560_03880 [Gemmatimonadetes bacterium]|nr:hypothetical protein [Gemmatimonadota bacterium]